MSKKRQFNLAGLARLIGNRMKKLKSVDDFTEPFYVDDGRECQFKIIGDRGEIILVRLTVYKEPII